MSACRLNLYPTPTLRWHCKINHNSNCKINHPSVGGTEQKEKNSINGDDNFNSQNGSYKDSALRQNLRGN